MASDNDNLLLIVGKTSEGKSASLRNINNPEGVMYLNTESNKKLPFKNDFDKYNITDPYQIYQAFTRAEEMDEIHTIVVDSLTYMMDQFESIHVLPAQNTMKAWGEYAQFFKVLMQQYVARSSKNVVFTAHTMDILNETENVMQTYVKVKGSLMNNGVESYFSSIVAAKALPLKALEGYESALLNTTEDDLLMGFKYVYQTMLTKDTVQERIRSPLSMWTRTETFIDNDIQKVIDRLHNFYA